MRMWKSAKEQELQFYIFDNIILLLVPLLIPRFGFARFGSVHFLLSLARTTSTVNGRERKIIKRSKSFVVLRMIRNLRVSSLPCIPIVPFYFSHLIARLPFLTRANAVYLMDCDVALCLVYAFWLCLFFLLTLSSSTVSITVYYYFRYSFCTLLLLLFFSLVLSLFFEAPLPISCFVSHLLSATGVPRYFFFHCFSFLLFCFVLFCVVVFFFFNSNETDNEFGARSVKGSVKFHAKPFKADPHIGAMFRRFLYCDGTGSDWIEKTEEGESRIRCFSYCPMLYIIIKAIWVFVLSTRQMRIQYAHCTLHTNITCNNRWFISLTLFASTSVCN